MTRPHRTHPIRVCFIDTDAAQVVHHATYVRYIEAARGEFIRAGRFAYRAWSTREGAGLAVAELSVRYRAPAYFDDLLEVETWVSHARRASIVFEYLIRRDGAVLTEARTRLACVTMAGTLRAMPTELLALCLGDEFDTAAI